MKGVLVAPGALHICYCHAPMRYIWNQYHEYRDQLSGFAKYAFSASAHYVRAWDFAAAQRVSLFVANSVNVADRIRHYYLRPSLVLYPPVDTSYARLEASVDDSYLAVGRLVAYKRMICSSLPAIVWDAGFGSLGPDRKRQTSRLTAIR